MPLMPIIKDGKKKKKKSVASQVAKPIQRTFCVLPRPNGVCAPSESRERSLNWVEKLRTCTPPVD